MGDAGRAQQDLWDRRAAAWDAAAEAMARDAAPFGGPAMDSLGLQPGERVLDIGCGVGATTVELARRVGAEGEVVAVDVSEAMLAATGRRVAAAGASVRLVRSDVADGAIGDGFDAAFSQFGLMFFPHPPAAFARIATALRPGGRLGAAVWGPLDDNPWLFVPTLVAAGPLGAELTLPGPGEPGPFSLADEPTLGGLLADAGFVDVAITRVAAPRTIAADEARSTVAAMLSVGPVAESFAAAAEDARGAAVDAVIAALEAYRVGDGWSVPAAARVVTARTPLSGG